jgi:hypothetical protein
LRWKIEMERSLRQASCQHEAARVHNIVGGCALTTSDGLWEFVALSYQNPSRFWISMTFWGAAQLPTPKRSLKFKIVKSFGNMALQLVRARLMRVKHTCVQYYAVSQLHVGRRPG